MREAPIEAPKVAIALVRVEQLQSIWPLVKDLLTAAIERSNGALTVPSLVNELVAERSQLWVVADLESPSPQVLAICVTDIGVEISGRKTCDIRIATGHDRKRWLDCRTHIEKWARDEMGCTWIRMTARQGYARELPDYRMTHVVLEKDLSDVGRQEANSDDKPDDQPNVASDTLRAGPSWH